MLSHAQKNATLMATEALAGLSDAHLYTVLMAHFEARPVNPDDLEKFANWLGRTAHMKARECLKALT